MTTCSADRGDEKGGWKQCRDATRRAGIYGKKRIPWKGKDRESETVRTCARFILLHFASRRVSIKNSFACRHGRGREFFIGVASFEIETVAVDRPLRNIAWIKGVYRGNSINEENNEVASMSKGR